MKKKLFKRSKEVSADEKQFKNVLKKTGKKIKSSVFDSPKLRDFKSKLSVLTRMVECHLKGRYRSFSFSSLALIAFALLYFLTPIDAIPDLIPAIGFSDDATVIYLIYEKLSKDIERFLEWEAEK